MRRPFYTLTALGVSVHNGYELAVGVGLVGQHRLGLARSAARGSPRWNPLLAFGAGASVAGAGVHFTLWPWGIRYGFPVLTEAEGLRQEQLPAYNAILYLWALAAVLAILRETPRGAMKWAAAGALTAPLLRSSARAHFEWLREQARTEPAWWNRAVAEKA